MSGEMTVTDGEFREVLPVGLQMAPLEVFGNRRLTPQNEPIHIPAHLTAIDWHPHMEELTKPTPKDYRRVATNKDGMVMYRYAPIAHFIKVANKTWASPYGPQWGYEIIDEVKADPAPNGNYEYTVAIQFVAPGLFRPIVGVGSSTFYANNPQESLAKTRNAALTSALKSALRQLGVARDIEEDDPEVAKAVDGRIASISLLFKKLNDGGRGDAAREIIRRHEPTALLDSGELFPGQIAFEHLEPIQRDLQALVIASVKKDN